MVATAKMHFKALWCTDKKPYSCGNCLTWISTEL